MNATLDMLEEAEEELLSRAFLYNHPASFRDGVEASMGAVRALLTKMRRLEFGGRDRVEGFRRPGRSSPTS